MKDILFIILGIVGLFFVSVISLFCICACFVSGVISRAEERIKKDDE